MLVKKKDLKPQKHAGEDGTVTVYEYGGLNEGMDLAVAYMEGNYPGGGKFTYNREVETMTYYVISGSGILRFKEGEEFEIAPGDCVFIKKGRAYQVEVLSDQPLEVILASNPVWSPEQVEVVD